MHKELARIDSTFLGVEDHGILTSMLHVTYEGGSGQGIGGYTFDSYEGETKGRRGSAFGMEFIRRTLETVGVTEWEKLVGKIIYVLRSSDNWGADVLGIESVSFGGKKKPPFIFKELANEYFPEEKNAST